MKVFFILIVTTVLHQSLVNAVQTRCKEVKALGPSTEPAQAGLKEIWVTGRVYSQTKPVNKDPKINYCCSVTYFDACGAVVSFKYTQPNGDVFTRVFAYNPDTDNIVYYQDNYIKTDPEYTVTGVEIISMSHINRSRENNESEVIPIDMKKVPKEFMAIKTAELAVVATNKKREYFIMITCDKKFAWLMFNEEVLLKNKMHELDSEIEEAVKKLGYFDFKDFHPVSTNLPLNIIPHSILETVFDPFQTKCVPLKAVATKYVKPSADTLTWYIVKVLPKAGSDSDLKFNHCSVVNYRKCCGGIKVVTEGDPHTGKLTVTTYAYGKTSNKPTIVKYIGNSGAIDNYFFVIQGKIVSMAIIHENIENESPTVITPIPEEVVKTFNQEFATIASDETMTEYKFNMTCDKQFAWLMVSEKALNENKLAQIETEVKAKVEKLNVVNWADLQTVTTEIPFENFLPILKV